MMKSGLWNIGMAARTGVLLGAALSASVACAAGAATPAAGTAPAGDVVATVAGKSITTVELLKAADAQLGKLKSQEYDIKKRVLDDMINQVLIEKEAASLKVTPEELVRQETEAKSPVVTDEEVNGFFEANKGRFPQDKSEAELKGLIRTSLQQQKTNERRSAFLGDLRTKYGVKVLLDPPRIQVSAGTAVFRGPASAPVSIVEWSDFQCPFCSRVNPTLKQVEETYGDTVRVGFRNYPLSFHPMAQKAAEAGECAKSQGKFWEMHDSMFADQSKLEVPDLKARATQLGLDSEKFNLCLDSGMTAAAIAADVKAGTDYGVSGTPAFFINGRFVNGAVPFEQFASVINEELERAGVPVPAKKVVMAAPAAPTAAAAPSAAQKPPTP